MNILVINCGSSTLKFQLVDSGSERCLAWGLVDRIGRDGSVKVENASGKTLAEQRSISDHGEATLLVLEWAGGAAEINAVGHRVVHGGNYFVQPTVIDEQVIDMCWQPAKVAHFETREIMGWMEVWRAP